MWLTGSWSSRRVSGLNLWGWRGEFRLLDHQRPPRPTLYQSVRALPEISVSTLKPNSTHDQQATVLDTPCQTTSKTGAQTHPSAESLPKIIISSQTPKNTTQDMVLPTRKSRYSLIQQNTDTSALHQEAYTTHWTNLTLLTGSRHQKQQEIQNGSLQKEAPNRESWAKWEDWEIPRRWRRRKKLTKTNKWRGNRQSTWKRIQSNDRKDNPIFKILKIEWRKYKKCLTRT